LESTVEWIKSDNINTPHTYLTYGEEMLSEMGAEIGRIAPKNSILVTCIAGSISCIGNAAIADRDVAFNQQINAIIPKEGTDPFFVYYLIIYSKDNIKKFSTHSMKGMISKGLFESIYFICPPSDLQREFGKFAEKIEQIKFSQITAKQRTEELFNSVLQKAFAGELVA
jgi:type I restriction enzyme, S subunit